MANITDLEHVDERMVLSDGKTLTNIAVGEGIPTQVANPSRSSWRTFVQSLVSFLIVLNLGLLILAGFLADPANGLRDLIDPSIYGAVLGVVNGAVLVGSAVSKLVALFMANPIVNAWITAHLPFLAPIKPAN